MQRKRIAFLVLSLFAPLLLVTLLLDAAAAAETAHAAAAAETAHAAAAAETAHAAAAPAVAPVVDTLADENDGSCADGDCSLRDAIATAAAGDAITFSVAGTIVLSPTLGDLDIGQDLTIDGGGVITVSGGDAVRVFNVTGSNVTFDSLTIANGNEKTDDCGLHSFKGRCGGGIMLQNSGVAVTVSNSTLSGNWGAYGGGIFNDGTLTVTSSTISSNLAANGGGIFNCGSVTVTNSTLTDNDVASWGGGIFNEDGSVMVSNSTLSGHWAGRWGGGIFNEDGSVTVSSSTLSGNSALWEGGGITSRGGSLTVTNSTLSANAANYGGGIFNDEGSVTVTNSTFSGNSAGLEGGGISTEGGIVTVSNSTLSGNSAKRGGGMDVVHGGGEIGDVMVSNSTLSGNSAELGGGILNEDGSVTVSNSTLSGNSAGWGGGIASHGGGATSTTLSNAIVSGNVLSGTTTADDLALFDGSTNSFSSGGYNLIGAIGPGITIAGPGDLTGVTDPLLGPLADNGGDTETHALLPGSQAIDNGECSSGPAADQRGVARPQDGDCDSGAFESRGFSLAMSGGSLQSTYAGFPFADPLALTVSSAYAEPVEGGQVTFSAPLSGAGLTFTETVAAIGGSGLASLPVTANSTAGGPYHVFADAGGNIGAGLAYELTNLPPVTLTRALSDWSMVSSYVQPADADFAAVMAPVAGQMMLAKNGHGEVYWPAYGIDQIGQWSAEEGYQVYVSEGATWTITGGRIDPAQSPIALAAGWNMVAYLRETPLAIGDALASISSELYLVKDGDGNVYWPDLPLDDIGDMQPGRGYQIYLNGPATLTYLAN